VAKYSARDVLDVFDDVAEKTLQPKLINKVLSGYGFFSPILENQKFILRLEEAYGDILFSQTLNHLILYSFNLNASKVMVMNNRGESLKKCNPVLYQLIGGTTAGYGIFPSNKVLLNDTGEGQFLVDAALIVNNPLLSMIIQVKKLYPNKKILVTYISLHTTDIAYRNKVRFYTGEIGSLKEYRLMIEHGRTQLINDYMNSLSSDFNFDYLTEIGVKEDAQWQRMNSFDFSKENLKIIDDFAKDIVKRNQKELDAVAEELLSD
jgi:patatin-like phospholipase/acyl hydrolase